MQRTMTVTDNQTPPRSRPQAHGEVYATPSAGLVKKYSLTSKEKERVDSADAHINQRRSLIENLPNDITVEYCHMMSRNHARNEDLMASLEWYWNMPYGSLNLNTRYNIFFAGADLHIHHGMNSWALLPDDTTINQYYDMLVTVSGVEMAEKSKFPEIQLPKDGFQYRFIPLGDSMKQNRILRQNEHAPPPNKDQFTIHFYPFDTLPPIRSHLHPKFVIFELGRKFHELVEKDSAAANAAVSSYPILDRVHRIYAAWSHSLKGALAFENWKKQDSGAGDGDRQSEEGYQRRRIGNATKQGPSATPAG
ncbi:hypothetical protein AGABI1DRAFT_114689 [Agaricus bisporus var. burnettii JB137-S8]|uniref:HNH nuclease domain-containing protein n=1 Tax=Agaricus bisporus var. burnettii (strain JB137-S8 / ATCC MYA-4627 / FGSC 10392) TaxID=597362 RepID=K5WSK6_AGABU|nr:uncharacterized protein AGABI1DRAFT_114689 [Agaricus bisporus var. burnettii JB137-S8]EKM78401.1 hypothetical protein AGABI1DRAFT_114689 [Agaricus bisporus var. burnettii JB137-S8]